MSLNNTKYKTIIKLITKPKIPHNCCYHFGFLNANIMTEKEILKASFIEVIKDTLLTSSSFYAQMALKYGDEDKKEQEMLDLSNKYYDTLDWFSELFNDCDEAE